MADDDTLDRQLEQEQLEELLRQRREERQIVWVDINNKGYPKETYQNFERLCQYWGITIRWNEMLKKEEIIFNDLTFNIDTKDNAAFAALIDRANRSDYKVTHLQHFVGLMANRNHYHPVRDWLDGLTWDQQDRLPEFYNLFELAEANPLKETLLRKWILSAVAAVYHENFTSEGCLTLQGEQGIGKSTSISRLLPQGRPAEWIRPGLTLNVNNKDSLYEALDRWICELGELDATFNRSDIEALKGFLTRGTDTIRTPYDRRSNTYPRRTVYYATVNGLEFLRDDENRRFWVLAVERIHFPKFDIEQLWAQMVQEYRQIADIVDDIELRQHYNESGWYLSPEQRQQLRTAQEPNIVVDPIDEILSNRVLTGTYVRSDHIQRYNATTLLQALDYKGSIGRSQTVAAGKWLRKNGFRQYGSGKVYDLDVVSNVFEYVKEQANNISRTDHLARVIAMTKK